MLKKELKQMERLLLVKKIYCCEKLKRELKISGCEQRENDGHCRNCIQRFGRGFGDVGCRRRRQGVEANRRAPLCGSKPGIMGFVSSAADQSKNAAKSHSIYYALCKLQGRGGKGVRR